ncbi:MAG: DUF542 domain-containing protein [Thermoanaerobaculia bacterium]
MNNDAKITLDSKLTVAEILRRFPVAEPILAARGLDTCCGGSHPLEEACQAHGIPVADVLIQLREAIALSSSAPAALVPSGVVNEGSAKGASCASKRPVAAEAQKFSPGFLIASLVITLTLGAGSGLFYLWRIGMGADVPLSHRQIHAHSQVLGFAALFIMGIALHALPRMLGAPLLAARLRSAILWLMVSGVVLRNLAQPFAYFTVGRVLAIASGLLEAGAGTIFVLYVFGVLRDLPKGSKDPLRVFLPVAMSALLVALGLSVAQGSWLAAQRDATLPITLTEPFYLMCLQGFVLASIFAFAGRMVPVFLGIGPARRGTFGVAATLQSVGLMAGLLSFLPSLESASVPLRDAGSLCLALAAIAYLAGTGILWRGARGPLVAAPGSPHIAIRVAFSSLALWATLTISSLGLAYATTFPARNPWWTDSARHVFTIGFLTLLVIGISFRVLPVFSGKTLYSPGLAQTTYALMVVGVLMRLLQYPAAYHPVLYQVGSYMGIPVVIALILFTVNMMKTVRPRQVAVAPANRSTAPTVPAQAFVSTLPSR